MMNESDSANSDEIIERFRAAFQSGENPTIDDWLEKSPSIGRESLLAKLVAIDVFFRLQANESVSLADYQQWPDTGIDAARKALREHLEYADQITETLERKPEPAYEDGLNRQSFTSRIGPYLLKEMIGKGGMGSVWRAVQHSPVEREIALKLIRADRGSPEAIDRFNLERQALAMLDHPNIAKIYDAGATEDGSPYFVMELVQGIPINRFCDDRKLGIRSRLELFIQLCRAIQHAHQKGIIHRDLKPTNVLVGIYDDEPIVKVIDFGLAKALHSSSPWSEKIEQTKIGQVLGTLQYMAPEQAAAGGSEVDTRSDVFSLGVILYELLTGTTPIQGDTLRMQPMLELLKIIQEQEPLKPSDKLSSDNQSAMAISKKRNITVSRLRYILSGELDWVVMKALEKERPRRYASANELAEEISRFLNSEPVVARPPSFAYRLGKIIKRHRWIAGTSVLLLLMLFVSLIFVSRYAIESAALAKSEAFQKVRAEGQAEIAKSEATKARRAQDFAEAQVARTKFHLANAQFANGEVASALESLGSMKPKHRQIEWGYANFDFQRSTLLLFGHSEPVVSTVFSPDGSWIATAAGKKIIVWDAVTGESRRVLTAPDIKLIRAMDINQNGNQLATVGNGTVHIWNSQSGSVLRKIDGLDSNVHRVQFHPKKEQVAISNLSNSDLEIWDTSSGRQLINFSTDQHVIESICFHPKDDWIVTAGRTGPLKIWDSNTGNLLKELIDSSSSAFAVRCVKFSPSGRLIAGGCDDGRVRVWDVEAGNQIQVLSGHTQRVDAIDFSPGEMSIASASYDHTVRTWDLLKGEQTRHLVGHSHWVYAIAYSPDGSRLASGGFDQIARVWDVADQSHAIVANHTSGSLSRNKRRQNVHLSSSQDGILLASASDDSLIHIWDLNMVTQIKTLKGHSGPVGEIRFFSGGKRLVAGTGHIINQDFGPEHHQVKIWDIESGEIAFELVGHQSEVPAVAVSPDESLIATGSLDGTIKLWGSSSGELLKTIKVNSVGINAVAICSDNQRIAAASGTAIRLFDIETGNLIRKYSGHVAPVQSVEFDSSNRRLISAGGGFDNTVKVWNLENGEIELDVKAHDGLVRRVQFTESEDRFVSAGDRTVKIWDIHTGEPLLSLDCNQLVTDFILLKNESRIVTASADGSLKIWERWNNLPYTVLTGHLNRIEKLNFSADSRYLYSETKTKKLSWDLSLFENRWNSILPVENPEMELEKSLPSVTSADGAWKAVARREDILLVPQHSVMDEAPDRLPFRRIKARPNHRWHVLQGAQALKQKNWFASAFHFGWANHFIPADESTSQKALTAFIKLEASNPDSAAILRKTMIEIFEY